MRRRQLRCGVAKGYDLQRRAHLGDFPYRTGIEWRNADPTAWRADHKKLRLQLSKGFAHRYVARIELTRDVVLSQRGVGLQCAGDNALSDGLCNA